MGVDQDMHLFYGQIIDTEFDDIEKVNETLPSTVQLTHITPTYGTDDYSYNVLSFVLGDRHVISEVPLEVLLDRRDNHMEDYKKACSTLGVEPKPTVMAVLCEW